MQSFPNPEEMSSAERLEYLNGCRQKVLKIEAGDLDEAEMSEEEQRWAVDLLQVERKASASRKKSSTTKAAVPALSLEDL